VQDLLAQDATVAFAHRNRLLVDELRDGGAHLRRGFAQIDARQADEIDALQQIAVDAQLQLLMCPLRRRQTAFPNRAGRRLSVDGDRRLLLKRESTA
jgi:hypothetical protein